jgi:hypothetical protein
MATAKTEEAEGGWWPVAGDQDPPLCAPAEERVLGALLQQLLQHLTGGCSVCCCWTPASGAPACPAQVGTCIIQFSQSEVEREPVSLAGVFLAAANRSAQKLCALSRPLSAFSLYQTCSCSKDEPWRALPLLGTLQQQNSKCHPPRCAGQQQPETPCACCCSRTRMLL